MNTLILDDGTEIEIVGTPAQGTRHTVVLGSERRSGQSVVVKIERIADALATERLAVQWVAAHGGAAPTVRAVSSVRLAAGRRAPCLVMDRVDGRAPESEAGWSRMGRSLGALAELPWTGCGLPVNDLDTFGEAHRQRVGQLARPLDDLMRDVADWTELRSRVAPPPGPLVITHGDPGPGNFLDDGQDGTLIDWEEAQVAPRGLDMARAIFIALLGSGPAGFVGRDHQAHARAAATGYLARLPHAWAPSRTELRWWLTVAGIQFAYRRRQRSGQPGVLPWMDALVVLATALGEDRSWRLE